MTAVDLEHFADQLEEVLPVEPEWWTSMGCGPAMGISEGPNTKPRRDNVPSTQIAKPIDWPSLAKRSPPERRWAIKGWLGFDHITMLVGAGGIGKTLLAQQIASHLAICKAGHSFIGEMCGPLKTLMWGCEDEHDEFWRRQVPIARSLGLELGAFSENLHIVPRHGLDNTMFVQCSTGLKWTPQLTELQERANDLKAQVVILDNAAQLYGAGENDRHAVTSFLNGLSGALPGRAILLLAHPARAAGSEFSGSSAWENTARSRWHLGTKLPDDRTEENAETDANARFLARRKANYSAKDWCRFTFQDGILVPDIIPAGNGLAIHLRAQKAERVLMQGARTLRERELRFTDGVTSPDFLPKKILEYKLGEGCSKRELADAMCQALLSGCLIRRVVGQNANRTPQYGLVLAD